MGKSFYIIRHIIMKSFIVLAASAIALASGLCLEDDEVVAMCTVGTDIGSKLEAAAAACENGPAAGRRRDKGVRAGAGGGAVSIGCLMVCPSTWGARDGSSQCRSEVPGVEPRWSEIEFLSEAS